MPSETQAIADMYGESSNAISPLLQRIRNMWEFANLCQWIYIFGKAAKIDDTLEIEDIETECLKPSSTVLSDIALALLKLVSSHRGLNHEILDDQLRKEYISKLPNENPLGDGATVSRSFCDLDTPTKVTVLQQLTQWVMSQPERLREKMEEADGIDQTSWRIEPYGWDADDRTYFVLDDNRVYRLTDAPEPFVRKPKKQKTYGTSRRSGRRRHTSNKSITEDCAPAESLDLEGSQASSNLGGMSWECVAITLDDLDVHLLPILEKQEESRKRKEAQHQRELLSLAKMANAKRSSRIAGKIEQHKEEEKARDQREKAQKQLESKQREKQNLLKLERERDFRMFSREKRLEERAARRRLHEEELAQLSEGHNSAPDGRVRVSDRQLQSEIDRNKLALKALEEEEEDWTFDCVCGLYGQVDDGAHSVACERCSVWQHSSCVGIEESEADRPDFHFICGSCRHHGENTSTPRKTIIKLKVKSSTELMGHHRSDNETSQANSQPMMESADLDTSTITSEFFNDPADSQLGILQPHTDLKSSPRTDTRSISNSDSTGRIIPETKPASAIAKSEGPKEPVVDTQPTLSSERGVNNAALVAAAPASQHATKSTPQAAPTISRVFSSLSRVSSAGSTTLSSHTAHSMALKQVDINGLQKMHSTRPSSDQAPNVSTNDAPTEN
ncbi:hypothetical protein LMH87_012033 [Akanthomyces muscarius]|uniref:Zinc finger PHD-type domain-containing protein n=1 Tax=Akanthomyces muscarius TaxID=2231603 RepID=A0A9W8ULL8_AKAMU|nr:hypothetical protein LMH87_012033 [Akanthomyces muscarius]KAJ4151326.1 hypothetical protein LMH87_012033 [Akanthomyces muscarius]